MKKLIYKSQLLIKILNLKICYNTWWFLVWGTLISMIFRFKTCGRGQKYIWEERGAMLFFIQIQRVTILVESIKNKMGGKFLFPTTKGVIIVGYIGQPSRTVHWTNRPFSATHFLLYNKSKNFHISTDASSELNLFIRDFSACVFWKGQVFFTMILLPSNCKVK